jgi:hypothetical protein
VDETRQGVQWRRGMLTVLGGLLAVAIVLMVAAVV